MPAPTVQEARSFVSDFVDPASLQNVADPDIIALHGRISTAVAKHAPNVNTGPWYDKFQDENVKNWVKGYGDAYPNAESMALKAFNLEKFVGADKAQRGLVVPATDKPEEWLPVWKRLGAPDKPDGYKVPDGLDKDPFTIKLRDHAHKIGMPKTFFDGVMGFLAEEGKLRASQQEIDFEKKAELEYNDVVKEWGSEFDAKVELGRRAAASLIPHKNKDELEEVLHRIEGAIGTKMTMNLWANIGAGMGEHQFVAGEGIEGEGGMTPEAARLRINALKKDPEFGKKLIAGDVATKDEWKKLHRIGFPESIEEPQYVM